MKHMSNISTDKKVKPKKKKNLAEKEGSKRKKSSVTKTSAAKQSNDNNGGAVTEKQSRPIKEVRLLICFNFLFICKLKLL